MPKAKPEPKPRRPIDEYEVQCLADLSRCTFAVGSPDKRFVRGMQGAADITQGQAEYLQRLVWRYRKQCGLSDEHARLRVEKLKQIDQRLHAEYLASLPPTGKISLM